MEDFKPSHLLIDEIKYELRIRGVVTDRPVDDKRKILNKLLAKERGRHLTHIDPFYDFGREQDAINKTLESISNLVTEFEGNEIDSAFKRGISRLNHVSGRISRILIPDDDDDQLEKIQKFKNESYATCLALEADLSDKATVGNATNTFPEIVNLNNTIMAQPTVPPVIHTSNKVIPVYKWNLKFNGDPRQLHPFLEKVLALHQSRGVSEKDLVASAGDLFVDKAFVWYRTIKSKVTEWDDLVKLLKQKFLPPDFEEEIWNDIKARKQGKAESTTIFIAVMETLFSRLDRSPAEATKIKYIRQNLLPQYVTHLALTEINNLDQLVNCCEKIENASYLKNKSQNQDKINSFSFLEPELLYSSQLSIDKGPNSKEFPTATNKINFKFKPNRVSTVSCSNNASSAQTNRTKVFHNSEIVCWNCGLPNHTYTSCKAKRSTFCYRCGERDFLSTNCPKCNNPKN
ncbi:uncharacterized protein LOC116163889 [Photinus pyralis]|uniref:CCHC-type domain-containing protein n=1 Tax=Photinus pyralis TaxID=7054 RepID=A0A1Y1K1F6_PHOPY|nr:uncharacterized protein LOC116163889 [Photinus pyralis]